MESSSDPISFCVFTVWGFWGHVGFKVWLRPTSETSSERIGTALEDRGWAKLCSICTGTSRNLSSPGEPHVSDPIASHNLFNFQDLNISEVLTPQTHRVQGVAERSWPWVPCQRPAVKEPKVKWSCAVFEYGLAPLRCFRNILKSPLRQRIARRESWELVTVYYKEMILSCPIQPGLGVLQRRMWSWQAARVWTSWRILEVRLYRSHVATAAATSSIRTWVAFAPSTACGGIAGSWRTFGRQLLGRLLVVHGCPHLNNCSVRRPSLPCRRLGAGPSSACSSRSRPQPRSSIAPRWWPSCSRCAEAALGINGF